MTHLPRPVRLPIAVLLSAALLMSGAVPAGIPAALAATPAGTVKLVTVASGLSSPVLATAPKDGSGRLFVVEKTGTIRIVKGGTLLPIPFLDISGSVSGGGEQGLLGLAFHPAYATNRKFYVDYTDTSGNTVIREYKASAAAPDRADTTTGRTILRIRQPFSNHNGGMVAFGPDGFLYIGMGDGGSGGDPGNRAQSTGTLLGKMLRIDINGVTATKAYRIPAGNPYVGKPGLDEIWQRGLRNPWRFSFDRVSGTLWIGDVGQNTWEEIDRVTKTATGPGRGYNWGWRRMEGFHCYNPSSGCGSASFRAPLLEYSHATAGRCAVTGGYVYRGSVIPSLYKWYVYGDYCSGEILAVPAASASRPAAVRLFGTGSGRMVSAFGEDEAGELYVCDLRGNVYRIEPA